MVGAPKTGTTSLYSYLYQFDDIYMSMVKEPNYFAVATVPDNSYLQPIRDTTRYLRLFAKGAHCKYRGEASPTYLLDGCAPGLIKELSPNARIIISIRDPVDTAYSFYLMQKRKGRISCTFADAVRDRIFRVPLDWSVPQLRLEFAFYSQSIEKYFEVFGKERVFISVFEEMRANTKGTIERIACFLDLPEPPSTGNREIYNMAGAPRSALAQKIMQNQILTRFGETLFRPPLRRKIKKIFIKPVPKPALEPEAREMLVELYAEDVHQVRELLGRQLPWPNFVAGNY